MGKPIKGYRIGVCRNHFFERNQEAVKQAVEAANFNSYQMKSSFDDHKSEPGRLMLNVSVPEWVQRELRLKGYTLEFEARSSGPINAILLDHGHGTMWGGSSNHGEDYGIAW